MSEMGSPFFRQPLSFVGSSPSVMYACVEEGKEYSGKFRQMNIHSLWWIFEGAILFLVIFLDNAPFSLSGIRYYCSDQFDGHDSIDNNSNIGYLQQPVVLLLICPSL